MAIPTAAAKQSMSIGRVIAPNPAAAPISADHPGPCWRRQRSHAHTSTSSASRNGACVIIAVAVQRNHTSDNSIATATSPRTASNISATTTKKIAPAAAHKTSGVTQYGNPIQTPGTFASAVPGKYMDA